MNKPVDLRSVDERLQQHAPSDVSPLHRRIKEGMAGLAKKVHGAFSLVPNAASDPFKAFSGGEGAMVGSVNAFTGGAGAPIDWAIDSFIASPKHGFCNHHLTLWLDSSVATPHLGMAMGLIPQLFFFCDLVPRSDLWVNTRELDRYHAKFNERTLALAADTRFTPFISREPYIRTALSPAGICIQGDANEANIDHLLGLASETLDTWIRWVADPEHTPESQREALAARDTTVRRTICWRDPANIVAERVLGKPMTGDLVRLLSAEARR